jgi:DNA invertase Pin-like site-specific DNA recombinase
MQLDDEKIKQGHAEGKPATEIARELGVGTTTIYNRAKQLGIKFPRSNQWTQRG